MLACLPHIESDLSAFHGVEGMGEMDSRRFFTLVPLLRAYPGAVAAYFAARDGEQPSPSPSHATSAPNVPQTSGARPMLFSRATSGGEA